MIFLLIVSFSLLKELLNDSRIIKIEEREHILNHFTSIFIKGKSYVKVIFWKNKCLDLISIHHLRGMTRCLVEFDFIPTISLGLAPSGVLGYDFLPREKNVSTRYPGLLIFH